MPDARLQIVPITQKEASAFISQHHRHHAPLSVGYVFSVAVSDGTAIRGVAVVGRPCARMLVDGFTLEVRRLATDGCKNACSALYAAAWRAAKALGYTRLITYILDSEPGTSLRAAGWKLIGQRGGGSWNRGNGVRPRVDLHPTQGKLLFEVSA